MNAVDLIAHEAAELPEALQAEVLDFIGYLRARHPQAPTPATSDAKLADLMAFFAPYRKDFGSFVFDRDEANFSHQSLYEPPDRPAGCGSRICLP